ncbi:Lipopolysaccharide-responsive and beige-like anchor protein [Giardia lamblia P15]|uniref:Lipopolysaccharide-responsive and beige-like anchor protein n=1 Tax=Giardia intestinalis (strain P15) TaxID=658858 RepID=E1EXB7_GIAIA|nr:Lipopolysaccharide-responsive and beige-like anchor protein [Giardia lamblia P15]
MWGRSQAAGLISSLKNYLTQLAKNQLHAVDNVLSELYGLRCNVALDKLVDQKYAAAMGYLLGSTLLHPKTDPQKAVQYIYIGLCSKSSLFALHFIHGLSLSSFLLDSLTIATTISSMQDTLLAIYSILFRELHAPLSQGFFDRLNNVASNYLGDGLDLLISNKSSSPNGGPDSLLNLYAQFLASTMNEFFKASQVGYHGHQDLRVLYRLRVLAQREPAILCINSLRVEQLLPDGISMAQYITATMPSITSWMESLSALNLTCIKDLASLVGCESSCVLQISAPDGLSPLLLFSPKDVLSSLDDTETQPAMDINANGCSRCSLARLKDSSTLLLYYIIDSRLSSKDIEGIVQLTKTLLQEAGRKLLDTGDHYDRYISIIIENTLLCCYYTQGIFVLDPEHLQFLKELLFKSFRYDHQMFLTVFRLLLLVTIFQPISIEEQQSILKVFQEPPSDSLTAALLNASCISVQGVNWIINFVAELLTLPLADLDVSSQSNEDHASSDKHSIHHPVVLRDSVCALFVQVLTNLINLHTKHPCPFLDNNSSAVTNLMKWIIPLLIKLNQDSPSASEPFYALLDSLVQHSTRVLKSIDNSLDRFFNVYAFFAGLLSKDSSSGYASDTPHWSNMDLLSILLRLQESYDMSETLLQASGLLEVLHTLLNCNFHAYASSVLLLFRRRSTNCARLDLLLQYAHTEFLTRPGPTITKDVLLGYVPIQELSEFPVIYNMCCLCVCISQVWISSQGDTSLWTGLGCDITKPLELFEFILLTHLFYYSTTSLLKERLLSLVCVEFKLEERWESIITADLTLATIFLASIENTYLPIICDIVCSKMKLSRAECIPGTPHTDSGLGSLIDNLSGRLKVYAQQIPERYYSLVVLACPYGEQLVIPIRAHYLEDASVLLFYISCLETNETLFDTAIFEKHKELLETGVTMEMAVRHRARLGPIVVGNTSFLTSLFTTLDETENERIAKFLPILLLHPNGLTTRWLEEVLLKAPHNTYTQSILSLLYHFSKYRTEVSCLLNQYFKTTTQSFALYHERMLGYRRVKNSSVYTSSDKLNTSIDGSKTLQALHVILHGSHAHSYSSSLVLTIFSIDSAETILTLSLDLSLRKLVATSIVWTYSLDYAFPSSVLEDGELTIGVAVSGFGMSSVSKHSSFILGTSFTPICGLTITVNGSAVSLRLEQLPKLCLPFKIEITTEGSLLYDQVLVSPFILTPFQISLLTDKTVPISELLNEPANFGGILGLTHDLRSQPRMPCGPSFYDPLDTSHTSLLSQTHPLSAIKIINNTIDRVEPLIVEDCLCVFRQYLEQHGVSVEHLTSRYLDVFVTDFESLYTHIYSDCKSFTEDCHPLQHRGFFCPQCNMVSTSDYLLFDLLCADLESSLNKTGELLTYPKEYTPSCPYCAQPSEPPSRRLLRNNKDHVPLTLYDTQTHSSQQSLTFNTTSLQSDSLVFSLLKAAEPNSVELDENTQPVVNHLASIVPLTSLIIYNEFLKAITSVDGTLLLDDLLFRLGYLEPVTSVPFYSGISLLMLLLQTLTKVSIVSSLELSSFISSQLSDKTTPDPVPWSEQCVSAFLTRYQHAFFKLFHQQGSSEGFLSEAKRTGVLGTVHHFISFHEQLSLLDQNFVPSLFTTSALFGMSRQSLVLMLGELHTYMSTLAHITGGDPNLLLRKYPDMGSKVSTILSSITLLKRFTMKVPRIGELERITRWYLSRGVLIFNSRVSLLQHMQTSSCFIHSQTDENTKLFLSVTAKPLFGAVVSANPPLERFLFPLVYSGNLPVNIDCNLLLPTCRALIIASQGSLSSAAIDGLSALFTYSQRCGTLLNTISFTLETIIESGISSIPTELANHLVEELLVADSVSSFMCLWPATITLSSDSVPLMLYLLRCLLSQSSKNIKLFAQLLTPDFWIKFIHGMMDAFLIYAGSTLVNSISPLQSLLEISRKFTYIANESFGIMYTLIAAEDVAHSAVGLAFIKTLSRATVFITTSLYTHSLSVSDTISDYISSMQQYNSTSLYLSLARHTILHGMTGYVTLIINRLANIRSNSPSRVPSNVHDDMLTVLNSDVTFDQLQISYTSLQASFTLYLHIVQGAGESSGVSEGSDHCSVIEQLTSLSLKTIIQQLYSACYIIRYTDEHESLSQLYLICGAYRTVIELCFDALRQNQVLCPLIDAFLATAFSLLASFLSLSTTVVTEHLDPLTWFRLSASTYTLNGSICNMEYFMPFISGLRIFYCLQLKAPQSFNLTIRYLLSVFEAIMVNNTPGELFKHYLSDLSMTLNAAQFFFTAPLGTGDIVGSEDRRTLSGPRSLLEPVNSNEFIIYHNVQNFDCTLQVFYRVIAPRELQKAFPIELEHIQKCASSSDPLESIYGYSSHLLLLVSLAYALASVHTASEDVVKVATSSTPRDSAMLADTSSPSSKALAQEMIVRFLFKNLRLCAIDKACASLASLLALLLSESLAVSLSGYVTTTEALSLQQCLELLELICESLAGASYTHHTSLHLSPLTQTVIVSSKNSMPAEHRIVQLHKELVENTQTDLLSIGAFVDLVFSSVLRLLARYLDLGEHPSTVMQDTLRYMQALYLLFVRTLTSQIKTLNSSDLFIEYVTCVFEYYFLAVENQSLETSTNDLCSKYEELIMQILALDILPLSFQNSLGNVATHGYPFTLIKQILQNDPTVTKLCNIYLGRAESPKLKLQLYKHYSKMLEFVMSKSVASEGEDDAIVVPSDTTGKLGPTPIKFGDLLQGLNFTKFKIVQGIINTMLLSIFHTSSADLVRAISKVIRAMIPFSSVTFFYFVASIFKLGSITCIIDLIQIIYGEDLSGEEKVKAQSTTMSLVDFIERYTGPNGAYPSTLQSSKFKTLVIVESYLFGRHCFRLTAMGLSGSVHLVAKSSSSFANAPVKAIRRVITPAPYIHLSPVRSGSIYYLLSTITSLSRYYHLGGPLTCIAGYHRTSHEFSLRIKNLFGATCTFTPEYEASKVLESLLIQLERKVHSLLQANSVISLADILPATELVQFIAYASYETELVSPNEGILILTDLAVYFIPGWRLVSGEIIYGLREHAFSISTQELSTEQEELPTAVHESSIVKKIVSSMQGMLQTLLISTRLPEQKIEFVAEQQGPQREILKDLKHFLTSLIKRCNYPPGRPVSEYSIAPVMSLSDSHTEQSALEKRCLTDIRLLLEQTANIGASSAQLLPFVTIIKLSDISSVLWKESAHRCTQVEVLLQQGEVYTYEILDSISSRRLRLSHYVNDHAFMLRVQQECSRSVLTKTPVSDRFTNCQLMLQNNSLLSAIALIFSLMKISLQGSQDYDLGTPRFEIVLPNVASLKKYISKWRMHLDSCCSQTPQINYADTPSEASLYEHPYELPFPQQISAITAQYSDIFKTVLQALNKQLATLLEEALSLITKAQQYFGEIIDSTTLYTSLLSSYHAAERPCLSLGPCIDRISESMPWSKLPSTLSIPILLFSGKLSHIEAVIALNMIAGRCSSDTSMYPVFPWLADDRDLTKTVMEQTDSKRAKYLDRYNSLTTAPFLAGSHYSTSGFVAGMLLRSQPFSAAALLLHDGKYDNPDRIFSSVADLWNSVKVTNLSECRELIPELFYAPNMFLNESSHDFGIKSTGEAVHDLVCDSMNATGCVACKDILDTYLHTVLYTLINRERLAQYTVFPSLYQWCRLLFGDKQSSLAHFNIYYWLTYPDSVALDCISNFSTRISTYSQLKNFGVCSRDVICMSVEERPVLQCIYQSVLGSRRRNETRTRIYDYFLRIDDLLKVLYPTEVSLVRTSEGEHVSTATADLFNPQQAVPWFYNLLLTKQPRASHTQLQAMTMLANFYSLAPNSLLILMKDMRTVAIINQVHHTCHTLNLPFLLYGGRHMNIYVKQCFVQYSCVVVTLTDVTTHLVRFDPDALKVGLLHVTGHVRLLATPPLSAVTVSHPHKLILVSVGQRHILYSLTTGAAIVELHAIEPMRSVERPSPVVQTQIADIAGRIWVLQEGILSCWSTSLALLYTLLPSYEITTFLAVADSLLLTGDKEGVLRVYTLLPSNITETVRMKIKTKAATDSESTYINLLCTAPAHRPSHPLAIKHTEYFRDRIVTVLAPKLCAEVVTSSRSSIWKIAMDCSHVRLSINDRVIASLSNMVMRLPRYIDCAPALPGNHCARCGGKRPEHYCHACTGHFCSLCMSTDAYFFPYQDITNVAPCQICANCAIHREHAKEIVDET